MDQDRVDDERITAYGRLVEAHAVLSTVLDRELRQSLGLPLLWYGVLIHVARSPQGMRPISELVNATAFTSGGVTRLVDRMDRAGYVRRQPCDTDRRVQFVAMTEAGKDMFRRATEIHLRGIQEHMMDKLEPQEVDSLNKILAKLIAGRPASKRK